MGAASIGFIATANATLQLRADPAMRGRVMALYAMAFLGSTPDRGAADGGHRPVVRPRVALLVGAVATILSAGLLSWRHGAAERRVPAVADPAVARAAELRGVQDADTRVA